jgi:hypothetical protein
MAKPLHELPYREPVTSRFRRIPSSQGLTEGTEWRFVKRRPDGRGRVYNRGTKT